MLGYSLGYDSLARSMFRRRRDGWLNPEWIEKATEQYSPELLVAARLSRRKHYDKLISLPRTKGRFPQELWDSGFRGWNDHRVPTHLGAAVNCDHPVLLTGETGTGKEVIARYVHDQSSRANGPFVAVNCAALPSELLYSELFGHKKGSFTGATENRPGRFDAADKGTVFLDEIGDVDARVQIALLRFLEGRKVSALGSAKETTVNARVICATHRMLESKSVRDDLRFRDDLYHRLRVIPVSIAPLRNNPKDIIFLFLMFLHEKNRRVRFETTLFPVGIIEEMLLYDWPGNVRELKNFTDFYAAYCRELRKTMSCKYKSGALIAFFKKNNAIEEFIGRAAYDKLQDDIHGISYPLITRFQDVDVATIMSLPQMVGLLHDPKLAKPVDYFRYRGEVKEFMVRHLYAIAAGNIEYYYEFAPELERDPIPSLRFLFRNKGGDFRRYSEIKTIIERDYFRSILQEHRALRDNAIAKLIGVHHVTVKKWREYFKLSRIDRPKPKKSSRNDKSTH